MAECTPEFTDLLRRIREGDQQAVQDLIAQYGHHILRVVRHKLDPRIRSKFDSIDFVQDVWASFFAEQPQDCHFETPEALIHHLVVMARNKVVDAYRQRCQYQKYNVDREHSLDGSAAYVTDNVAAEQPTPSQVAVANEQWEQLMKGTPVHYRRVLIMLQDGKTHQEIASELDIDERTVRRLIAKLAQRQVS